MAIVEMKRVGLLAMTADRDKLMRILQRAGCVEITETEGDIDAYLGKGKGAADATDDRLGRIRWTITQLGRYYTEKKGFLSSLGMPTATEAEADAATRDMGALMAVVEAVEACERRSGELRGHETRIRAQIDQLLPWRSLDVPVERICDTRDTAQFVGTVNNRELPGLRETFSGLTATVEHVGDERDSAYIWVVAHKGDRENVQNALKAADFSAVQFTGETGTVANLLDGFRSQLDGMQAERDRLEGELKVLAADVPRLKVLYEVISAESEREHVVERMAQTDTTFLMEGWAPAGACEMLEKRIAKAAPDASFAYREPTEEEKPPTLLHNSRAVAPFETIVTSYSYPDPRGFDPTAIMAPFFACLFGMMLSDAGYGLVMAIAIPFIIHFAKPKEGTRKLMWVMFYGGIFTVIWGAVFNTWFGANPSFLPTLIDTLNDPMPMLALCMAMGALHLFTGLGVAAYVNIKRGKYLDALFDQGFWFILVVGLPLMLLPQTAAIGKWMAIGGAVGILLTAGRDKPNIVSRLISGGGALYNISSWLSDLLSYMRLFGMGLATGVIGMVINMLVGLIMGNGIFGILIGVVVLIGGHLFNFAINALGAYVHSCRLQYIEFFSKFYEDGGDPFRPLAQKPLYVAICETNADGVEQ